MKLNPKQLAFVDEYLISRNATEAYTKAGYKNKSEKANGASASRLLGNVNIATLIDERSEKQFKATDITVEFILDGIRDIALDNTARHNDKLKAYELLGKYKKLFTERTEISGSIDVGVNIVDDL